MAAETENISKTLKDSIEIPTANLGFNTAETLKKVSPSDTTAADIGNSDGSEKQKYLISGIMADNVEKPKENPGLLTMASSIKVSPSDCDNDR